MNPESSDVIPSVAIKPKNPITPKEYERRKLFLEAIQRMTAAEHLEIVRLMKTNGAYYSENINGIFFDLVDLDQPIFEDLEKFAHFVAKNRTELATREELLSTMCVSNTVPLIVSTVSTAAKPYKTETRYYK